MAVGIIVNAHTTYPKVAGNPLFSGISIMAPQTPIKMTCIRTKLIQPLFFPTSKIFKLFATSNYYYNEGYL